MTIAPNFREIRKSKMFLGEVYFWTDTVKDWKRLFDQDKYKQLIIDILKELVDKKLIIIYGFVIMPNHLHVIWELLAKNGREMPHASFNKKTAHLIVIDLKNNHPLVLSHFKVEEKEREYRIWQQDPLAVLINSREKLEQKLDYLHLNPLQERWSLAGSPEEYNWSSARFYEEGKGDFGFLTHYMERFE